MKGTGEKIRVYVKETFKITSSPLPSDQRGLEFHDFSVAWWLAVQALESGGLVSAYNLCHFRQVP